MYHGLRKALAPGVRGAVQKDTRVAAVEESFGRLRKGVDSLSWAVDNCERSWASQAEFCKYLPLIGGELYAADDTAARTAMVAAADAASALSVTVAAPVLAPVRAELSSLMARVRRLEELKGRWLNLISDKAYYDEKYAKLAASLDKDGKTARDAEREKKAMVKKAHTAEMLERMCVELSDEFEGCVAERLLVADKVFIAVFSAQSNNARLADFGGICDMLASAQFGTRTAGIPRKDAALAEVLTGSAELRRRSSSETSSSAGVSQFAPPPYAPPPHTSASSFEQYVTAPRPAAARPVPPASAPAPSGQVLVSQDAVVTFPTASPSAPQPTPPRCDGTSFGWDEKAGEKAPPKNGQQVDVHGLSFKLEGLSTAEESSPSAPPAPPSPTDSIFTYCDPNEDQQYIFADSKVATLGRHATLQ